MSHDRPTPAELAEAVREFLEAEILPTLTDHRLRFRTLVAMNALGIARREPERGPELRELRGGLLREIPEDALEEAFLACFRGVVPEATRFLGGESIGELLDRALPALDRLLADRSWDTVLAVLHGGVNRAI